MGQGLYLYLPCLKSDPFYYDSYSKWNKSKPVMDSGILNIDLLKENFYEFYGNFSKGEIFK